MFDSKYLYQLTEKHKSVFSDLALLEKELNRRFYEMDEPIKALILSIATGEPMLLIGDPGTAKSKLIRTFCEIVGIKNTEEESSGYFEYLLTQFTEPSELFGYYDIESLLNKSDTSKKGLVRLDKGMMQHAQVIFLDEVFNASSSILNTLLTFMNERVFHDRGKTQKVEMRYLFGATNDIPKSAELRAFYDRFLIRYELKGVATKFCGREDFHHKIKGLVEAGWYESYKKKEDRGNSISEDAVLLPHLLEGLHKFRVDLSECIYDKKLLPLPDSEFYRNFAAMVKLTHDTYKITNASNRRLVKFVYVMLVHRLYRFVRDGEKSFKGEVFDVNEILIYLQFLCDKKVEGLEDKIRGSQFNIK